MALINEAERSRRPDKARAMFVAATTGLRRAELCALRRRRDIDWDQGIARVAWSIVAIPGQPLEEIPTKNRRVRHVRGDRTTGRLDPFTLAMLATQVEMMEQRARVFECQRQDDCYVF